MTDLELLEAAAEAAIVAGMPIIQTEAGPQIISWHDGKHECYDLWNPLTDDGDALRLAVMCSIEVDSVTSACATTARALTNEEDRSEVFVYQPHGTDPYAATRRAIVRAAAALAGATGAGGE